MKELDFSLRNLAMKENRDQKQCGSKPQAMILEKFYVSIEVERL